MREMISSSKREYELSKNTQLEKDRRRNYFQQACEKLYKTMIHILELKSGYNIKYHEQILDDFFW